LRILTLLLLLPACDSSTAIVTPVCELGAPVASPSTATVGDVITLGTVALTDSFDTLVMFGSVRAEVREVTREGCNDCDSCVTDTGNAGCNACIQECNACAELCVTCVEEVRIRVPDVPPGEYAVTITHARGTTPPVVVTVTK
jgi:hypothetical protein